MTAPATRVPGYALDAPTSETAISAFEKHIGRAEAERTWASACAAVGVPRSSNAIDNLRAVARHLTAQPGIVGVCASSLQVRLISYSMLLKKAALAATGANR